MGIAYEKITNKDEIEILRDKGSVYKDFSYKYNGETIDLLKKNFDRDKSYYLLAKNNDDFAGFISCDTDWWEDDCFFLREIFVDPNFQKQGIGKKLMNACIEHAKKNGAKFVVTETAFENIPMQKLCEELGFRKWDNPEWEEGITYKLKLI